MGNSTLTETTTAMMAANKTTNNSNSSANFYHVYYESKRKNVSRLLTTLIAPSDSPPASNGSGRTTLLLGPHVVGHANGSGTNTIRTTSKNYVSTDKRPTIIVFPTGKLLASPFRPRGIILLTYSPSLYLHLEQCLGTHEFTKELPKELISIGAQI